jgi:hypothetical protein
VKPSATQEGRAKLVRTASAQKLATSAIEAHIDSHRGLHGFAIAVQTGIEVLMFHASRSGGPEALALGTFAHDIGTTDAAVPPDHQHDGNASAIVERAAREVSATRIVDW